MFMLNDCWKLLLYFRHRQNCCTFHSALVLKGKITLEKEKKNAFKVFYEAKQSLLWSQLVGRMEAKKKIAAFPKSFSHLDKEERSALSFPSLLLCLCVCVCVCTIQFQPDGGDPSSGLVQLEAAGLFTQRGENEGFLMTLHSDSLPVVPKASRQGPSSSTQPLIKQSHNSRV